MLQRPLRRISHAHVHHLPDQPPRPIEHDGMIALGATEQLAVILARSAFDQHPLHRAESAGADALDVQFQRRQQLLQPRQLYGMLRFVGPRSGRRARRRAEDEAERTTERSLAGTPRTSSRRCATPKTRRKALCKYHLTLRMTSKSFNTRSKARKRPERFLLSHSVNVLMTRVPG